MIYKSTCFHVRRRQIPVIQHSCPPYERPPIRNQAVERFGWRWHLGLRQGFRALDDIEDRAMKGENGRHVRVGDEHQPFRPFVQAKQVDAV